MGTKSLLTVLYKGVFGQATATRLRGSLPETILHDLATGLPSQTSVGGDTLAVLSAPDFHLLESIGRIAASHRFVAALLLGKYVLVTPLFAKHTPCVACFRKRFLAFPPLTETPADALLALVHYCAVNPSFEFTAFHPMAADTAAALARRHLERQVAVANLFDVGGFSVQRAGVTAVHGCSCRRGCSNTSVGPERFADFSDVLRGLLS